MSYRKGEQLRELVGNKYPAADGGSYGIYVVGCIPEKDDLVVLYTHNGVVEYGEPRRLDGFKASYRYCLD
jgi:hypothetical protein